MNQHTWKFAEPFYRPYRIGVLHGPNSGHVLIYVNSKILLIDFKVFDDKEYSFYLDEQLCKLEIHCQEELPAEEKYEYVLTVGDYRVKAGESPEPQSNFVDMYKSIAFFVGAALIFALGMYFLINFQNNKQYNLLGDKGKPTPCILFVKEIRGDEYHVRFEYVAQGEHIKKEEIISERSFMNLEKEELRDQVYLSEALYYPRKPKIGRLNYH